MPSMNLKAYREKKGWTQAQLAHLAGIDRSTIQRLEAGIGSPSYGTASQLAVLFDCRIEDLFPVERVS